MSNTKKVVLVTRPEKQSGQFINLLKDKNIETLAFPCIEIQAVKLDDKLKEIIKEINNYQLIIFISSNAVVHAVQVMQQCGVSPSSISAKIATIGKATLAKAKALGFDVTLSPNEGFNSEALLALLALEEIQSENVRNHRCLIIRGVGGLEYLADELQKRGALVSYAEVYQRIKPIEDIAVSRQELSDRWSKLGISVITVTSNEALQNLYEMIGLPGKDAMLNTLLIVASLRILKRAEALGFKVIKCAQSAVNQHMLETIDNEFK